MTTPTQPADLLALVPDEVSQQHDGDKDHFWTEGFNACRDEVLRRVESLAAHRGEVEPVAWIQPRSIAALNMCRNDTINGVVEVWMRPTALANVPLFTSPPQEHVPWQLIGEVKVPVGQRDREATDHPLSPPVVTVWETQYQWQATLLAQTKTKEPPLSHPPQAQAGPSCPAIDADKPTDPDHKRLAALADWIDVLAPGRSLSARSYLMELSRKMARSTPQAQAGAGDAEVMARAWRNRFIDERMNAYPEARYEMRRCYAETDANNFETAFRRHLEAKP